MLKNISPADIMSRAGAKRKTRTVLHRVFSLPGLISITLPLAPPHFLRRQLFRLLTRYLGTDMTDNKSCFSFIFWLLAPATVFPFLPQVKSPHSFEIKRCLVASRTA